MRTLRIFVIAFIGVSLLAGEAFAGYAVQLPKSKITKSMYLDQALQMRRSVHAFNTKKVVSMQQISQLLWAGQGVTGPNGQRTAPSAGAIYPLKIYVLNKSGVWSYAPKEHVLKMVVAENKIAELSKAALAQNFIKQASVVFVIIAYPGKTTLRYFGRGSRFVSLEAGHVAQNILLEAVSQGLAATPVGGFDDLYVGKILRLSKKQQPLYIIPIGYSK
ncbi:MAG: SagB/ThcOx family dehydrogenase [Gammaproteobacteria bacterium]|nr:SagB/ThcOx family dehydrogenase [Gammaproteobacteria bacterium]